MAEQNDPDATSNPRLRRADATRAGAATREDAGRVRVALFDMTEKALRIVYPKPIADVAVEGWRSIISSLPSTTA